MSHHNPTLDELETRARILEQEAAELRRHVRLRRQERPLNGPSTSERLCDFSDNIMLCGSLIVLEDTDHKGGAIVGDALHRNAAFLEELHRFCAKVNRLAGRKSRSEASEKTDASG